MRPRLQSQELRNQTLPERIAGGAFEPYKLFPGILIPEAVCRYITLDELGATA
jgi:hypothetical protein